MATIFYRGIGLLAATVPVFTGRTPRDPMPKCAGCLAAEMFDAPGIGFDLTHSYGVSAAHLVNGSVFDIAKVPAQPEYIALIASLVNTPPPDPLTRLERWRRYLNKNLGLPATPHVGTLAAHLASLRDATASALATKVDYVVVTHPPLSGLRQEDITDAIEYADIRSWLNYKLEGLQGGIYPTILSEAHAAFAATGKGLCKSYRDLFRCWSEEDDIPYQVILTASFSRSALTVSAGVVTSPFRWSKPALLEKTYMELGFDALDEFVSPDKFWAQVRSSVADIARRGTALNHGMEVIELLLLGENATYPDFINAVRDGIYDSLPVWMERGSTAFIDPVFAGARGAAHYARWRQEAPLGCTEMEECDKKREDERGALSIAGERIVEL